jgi:hypothetical protein
MKNYYFKSCKYNLYILTVLSAMLFSFNFLNCYDTSSVEFTIKVDSVSFPQQTFNQIDSLKAAFWGTIGSDECYSFLKFEVSNDTNSTVFSLIGLHLYTWRNACRGNGDPVLLNGKIYNIFPVYQGTYKITVNQPDGSKLEKQILIH